MINFSKIYLFGMCMFHVIIWIIAILGSIYSKKIAIINMLIILPYIYIFQAVNPIHLIVLHKIRYIEKNIDKFNDEIIDYNLINNEAEQKNIKKIALSENKSVNDIAKYYAIMIKYDHKCILPLLISNIRDYFDFSFKNPFDPSGMIILGYIFNSYMLLNIKSVINTI